MFLLQATPAHPIDIDALRAHFEDIGESVLVAGDSKAVKVHVHNDRPDLVIGHGLTLGTLSRISVENLDNQARDVREARAESFTGVSAEPTERSTNGTGPALTTDATASGSIPLAVVAVAAGDGLAAIFQEFGVAAIVRGGQSANPSTGELLEAIERTDAAEVVVLPNNPNVVLAARQVATMAKRAVTVIPTRNAAEGFAALLCLDPAEGAEANTGPMTEAARSIQTLQVTEAVRDATIGKKKVKGGQTIALDPDEGLVAVDNDRMRCILEAVGRLRPGFELVTVFYGADAGLDEAEAVAKRIQLSLSGVDVELRHGGQPHYRYLISAE
jgi:dihydroxyacetone kinase-like predicted kinase